MNKKEEQKFVERNTKLMGDFMGDLKSILEKQYNYGVKKTLKYILVEFEKKEHNKKTIIKHIKELIKNIQTYEKRKPKTRNESFLSR